MASKIVFYSEFPNILEKIWGRIEMGGILFEKLFFLVFDGMQKFLKLDFGNHSKSHLAKNLKVVIVMTKNSSRFILEYSAVFGKM